MGREGDGSSAAMADQPKVIEGTMRPDGTMRKAVKIRPGYTPPDEVQKFATRGSKFRELQEKSTLPTVSMGSTDERSSSGMTKAQKKNAARKRAKATAAAAGEGDAPALTNESVQAPSAESSEPP